MSVCNNCLCVNVCNKPNTIDCKDYMDADLFYKLPCKIGEIVYMVAEISDNFSEEYYKTVMQVSFRIELISSLGKNIFLNKYDAYKSFN